MSTFGFEYMIDNNALNQLSKAQLASKLFRGRGHIPSEVLYEARDSPHITELRAYEYVTTPAVLAQLVRVMATVPTSDTKLVDLYANRGNADPLIVACALDARDNESKYLNPKEWVIVTDDNAVRYKAEEFGLRTLGNAEFAALIDSLAHVDRPQ